MTNTDTWPVMLDWAERRRDEDPESLTFLEDRFAEMDEDDRPTDKERHDLSLRVDAACHPITDADWILVIQTLPDGGRRVFAKPRTAAMARVWPTVLYDWQRSRDLASMATSARLKKETAEGNAKAREPHAADALRASVARRLAALLDIVGREPDENTSSRVSDWLEAHGLPDGGRFVREQNWEAARWADPLFVARVLAQVTWKEETQEGLSRASVPGMNLAVVGDLARARTAHGLLLDGGGWVIKDRRGARIGAVAPSIDSQLVKPELLKNATTQMLIRVLLTLAHQQRVTGSLHDRPDTSCTNADKVFIVGGWRRAAQLLGMSWHRATEVREATLALAALRLRTPEGEGQVLSYWEQHGHRGQQALLELTLSGPLGSHYVHKLDPKKHDRRIVPVPVPSLLPPFVGKPNERGGELMLQLLMMMRFRDLGGELMDAGGIPLEARDWKQLLDEAELRSSLLPTLRDAWQAGKGDAPPILKEAHGGRFDLGDRYANERAFIVAGVEHGREKAKQAMARRRRARR